MLCSMWRLCLCWSPQGQKILTFVFSDWQVGGLHGLSWLTLITPDSWLFLCVWLFLKTKVWNVNISQMLFPFCPQAPLYEQSLSVFRTSHFLPGLHYIHSKVDPHFYCQQKFRTQDYNAAEDGKHKGYLWLPVFLLESLSLLMGRFCPRVTIASHSQEGLLSLMCLHQRPLLGCNWTKDDC